MRALSLILLVLTSTLLFDQCFSSNILVLLPSPSRSHLITAQALTKELALRGHEVTVVSPFPLENPPKNYHDIVLKVPDFMKGNICR